MNILPVEKRVQILTMLCEGSSMRSTARITGVSINTVYKLLEDAGAACAEFHDRTVRNLTCTRVESDEIWSFCLSKDKNTPKGKEGAGSVWTWTSIDPDSRLIINWVVGDRTRVYADVLMDDLASRLKHRIQLTTDGFSSYIAAVESAFGINVDYSMLNKVYGADMDPKNRTARLRELVGIYKSTVKGKPNPKHVGTSFVERMNLTIRQGIRRFARKTNAHSKKLANHCHALSLYFVWYNFVRIHSSLRVTPAMAAGITDKTMEMKDIVGLIDKMNEKTKRMASWKKKSK